MKTNILIRNCKLSRDWHCRPLHYTWNTINRSLVLIDPMSNRIVLYSGGLGPLLGREHLYITLLDHGYLDKE
jgi:hypothetical protein